MVLYPRNHNLHILTISFSYHYLQNISDRLLKAAEHNLTDSSFAEDLRHLGSDVI
jgi:hypothetical protein